MNRIRMSSCMKALAAAVAVALSSAGTATAQTYPSQPIHLIVPFAPGGGMESAVRTVVQTINESGWPQLIVDNRPGGAGTIAALATRQAAPDGYTLMLAAISTHAINATLIPDLKYDPLKDFTPITLLFSYPSVVAVPARSPARTLADLIAMAQTKPGGITYGSPGIGTLGHILPLMLSRASGTAMVHVPYRGGGPAMLDLLAGRTDFMILNPAGIIPNIRAGRLRALAVTSKARLPYLPDVPTTAELSYPDVYLDGWFGIVAPAGLPQTLVATIHDKFATALTSPDLNRRLTDQGWIVDPIPPSQFRALIRSDMIRLGKLLKNAGAKSPGSAGQH